MYKFHDVFTHTDTQMHTHMHTHTLIITTPTPKPTRTPTPTCTSTHTHTHTHTRTHIHAHTYTCIRPQHSSQLGGRGVDPSRSLPLAFSCSLYRMRARSLVRTREAYIHRHKYSDMMFPVRLSRNRGDYATLMRIKPCHTHERVTVHSRIHSNYTHGANTP